MAGGGTLGALSTDIEGESARLDEQENPSAEVRGPGEEGSAIL